MNVSETKKDGPILVDGKRVAYFSIVVDGGFGIGISVENEKGYRPVDDYGPYKDEERAKGVAERLNYRIRVSHDDAVRIILSTMGMSRRGQR